MPMACSAGGCAERGRSPSSSGRTGSCSRRPEPRGPPVAGYGRGMQIDKNQILELLRNQGDDANAQQAYQELPGTVDTDQHAGILEQLGLSPMDLISKLGGGGGLGGLLGGPGGRSPPSLRTGGPVPPRGEAPRAQRGLI